ncbi:MAG: hypothetical protein M0Z38_05015 [Deltaproteobacteria bacterium]|nr:hypothetical protein [Deltaproteobacteria bacterium]
MKKIVAIVVAAGLLGAMAPSPASAGQREWATAGKILTGVIGLHILGNALANPYPYHAPAYAPPPRVYYPPEQVWVPGRYETRLDRQWVPGHWEIERAGRHRDRYDRYDGDDDDGRDGDDGYGRETRRVWIPGHYRDVEVRMWVPGHWEG